MSKSVFEELKSRSYSYRYRGTLEFRDSVHGGTPSNDKVAKAWIETKFKETADIIQQRVAETMAERGVVPAEAMEIVGDDRLLKGFKKDEVGIYLEGRTLKANLKEACAVAQNAGKISDGRKFGLAAQGKKGIRSFFPEHLFIPETKLYLQRDGENLTKFDDIEQRFVHVRQISGIVYEEIVNNATLDFTVETDYDFESNSKDFWGHLWLTAGSLGLGSSRSMGYGRYDVIRWDQIS